MSEHIAAEPLLILHVEDNPAHAELVCRSLETHRIANRLIQLSDGEAALEYLFEDKDSDQASDNPTPHVIILDLRLPRIGGLEVLKRIRASAKYEGIAIVVLTTSAAEQDVAKAYEYRANSYLVKPLDFVTFSKMMDDCGFYWMAWNKKPAI